MQNTKKAVIRDTTGNVLSPGMYGYEEALAKRTIPAEKPKTWIEQANRQVSDLIATLEEMETCEASAGNDCGMYATPHLSNIRYVISKVYEVKDAMEVL